MKYQIRHTIDELGGRSCSPGGWASEETEDLDYAIKQAEEITREGKCGFVMREDEAILAPDHTWVPKQV